jgi:hypothetical protein
LEKVGFARPFSLKGACTVKQISEPGIFKPTPSRMESRSDTTTRVAREIINSEAAAWTAKAERLRAGRLAREAIAAAHVAMPRKKR